MPKEQAEPTIVTLDIPTGGVYYMFVNDELIASYPEFDHWVVQLFDN